MDVAVARISTLAIVVSALFTGIAPPIQRPRQKPGWDSLLLPPTGPDGLCRLQRRAALASGAKLVADAPNARQGLAIRYVRVADLLARRGDWAAAISVLYEGLALLPDSLAILNDLAWRLATAPDVAMRDGAKAVELAEHANALAGGESCNELDTLAAAYARARRFDEAIVAAEKALAIATRAGQDELASQIAARLDLFKRGNPYPSP